jgi:hypothetical protein
MKTPLSRSCLLLPLLAMVTACFVLPAAAQSTGGIAGKVKNERGGGVAGVTVTARQKGADIKSATSGPKGDFVLEGLEPGSYNFVFEARGYATAVLYNTEVRKGKPRNLGERLILTPDKGSLIILKGVIFYRDFTSIAGATVDLYVVNSDGSSRKAATAYTDGIGEFGFRQPEGVKKLRIKASFRGVTATKEIEVDQPMVYRTTLALDLGRGEK